MTPHAVWVVSELYYPEETSTGFVLTTIAEGLAGQGGRHVRVLCGQPNYSARGQVAPAYERRHGVDIERCFGLTLDKNVVAFRILNGLTLTASVFLRAVRRFRRGDVVLVVTNPPLLPFAMWAAARLRGARLLLLVHDVYPDVLVATGMATPRSLLTRLVGAATRRLYRGADRVIAIGRDMQTLVRHKLGPGRDTTVCIPNWADLDLVAPVAKEDTALGRELGLAGKFVVQYAGNMGRPNGIETLFEAARLLADDDRIRFVCIGTGARRPWLERQLASASLQNVVLLGGRPRSDQPNFLNACDVALIPFVRGMVGLGVPSRSYNVLAAGKPIVAVMEPEAELARVVVEENVGWVVPPEDPAALARAIRDAASDPARLAAMGARARAVAERRFSLGHMLDAYDDVLTAVGG